MARNLEVVPQNSLPSDSPELKAIMEDLKTYGDYGTKTEPEIAPTPVPKTLSQGERMVEEAKARNRAILAQMKTESDKAQDTNSNLTDMQKLKLEDKKIRDGWKKEVRDTLRSWQREQAIFLGRLKEYKENTFALPVKEEKIVEKKADVPNLPQVSIVNSAFDVPIRDQRARPTCTAFAGVRAMEIILAQNKEPQDLSEQYFYWASKPDCQTSPCDRKGSWITTGLDYSKEQPLVDIPREENCSYKIDSLKDNETQIPLGASCHQGTTQVVSYEQVLTLDEAVERLKKNIPVIMAAKLTENFYVNKGLVKESDAVKSNRNDGHEMGHAFLGVGVLELPEKLKPTEGQYCVVVANSWGKGWGAGGYSCLTETWLTNHRQKSPFVAVTKLNLK